MKFLFERIPSEIGFSVFDRSDKKKPAAFSGMIPAGDYEVDVEIPENWISPHRSIAPGVKYYLQDGYGPIVSGQHEEIFSGADFYLDVSRDPENEELNQQSVETLIHSVCGNNHLTSRQKFYICLVSLQSFYEHLVYGMLVESGYKSRNQYESLRNHEDRTEAAFSVDNTNFFSTDIEICPGKEGLGDEFTDDFRAEANNIFDEVRKLRNKVVHGWGYKDVSRERLIEIFDGIGEQLVDYPGLDDDRFFSEAAFLFVRLYARTQRLKNQLAYFIEKNSVRAERESRGY